MVITPEEVKCMTIAQRSRGEKDKTVHCILMIFSSLHIVDANSLLSICFPNISPRFMVGFILPLVSFHAQIFNLMQSDLSIFFHYLCFFWSYIRNFLTLSKIIKIFIFSSENIPNTLIIIIIFCLKWWFN